MIKQHYTDVALNVVRRNLLDRPYDTVDDVERSDVSKWGLESDLYERWARSCLLAAFLVRSGELDPATEQDICVAVQEVINERLDPDNSTGWRALVGVRQSFVETGGLATAYMICPRMFVQSTLQSGEVAGRAADYLRVWFMENVDRYASDNNWLIYKIMLVRALKALGEDSNRLDDVELGAALRIEHWYRDCGWYADGPGNSFDYYNSWSFHFYLPLLEYLTDGWVMGSRSDHFARCAEYTDFVSRLIDPEGAPVFMGRSMTYRFGVVAPVALTALHPETSAVAARNLGIVWRNCVDFFLYQHVSASGRIRLGYIRAGGAVAQRYSGFGSSYWCMKAFVALLIPSESAFWDSDHGPVQSSDIAPCGSRLGFVSAQTKGVAHLLNHASDFQRGRRAGWFHDDALYASLSFSSCTAPVCVGGIRSDHFALLQGGRGSDRGPALGMSSGAHWISSRWRPRYRIRGSKMAFLKFGKFDRIGPRTKDSGLEVVHVAIVADVWIVDLFKVVGRLRSDSVNLRFGSWAVPYDKNCSDERLVKRDDYSVTVRSGALMSVLVLLAGYGSVNVADDEAENAFGDSAVLPFASGQVRSEVWCVTARCLTRTGLADDSVSAVPVLHMQDGEVTITHGGRSWHVDARGGVDCG